MFSDVSSGCKSPQNGGHSSACAPTTLSRHSGGLPAGASMSSSLRILFPGCGISLHWSLALPGFHSQGLRRSPIPARYSGPQPLLGSAILREKRGGGCSPSRITHWPLGQSWSSWDSRVCCLSCGDGQPEQGFAHFWLWEPEGSTMSHCQT